MGKYGFDYFSKRVDIISEMARPRGGGSYSNIVENMIPGDVMSLYDSIQKKLLPIIRYGKFEDGKQLKTSSGESVHGLGTKNMNRVLTWILINMVENEPIEKRHYEEHEIEDLFINHPCGALYHDVNNGMNRFHKFVQNMGLPTRIIFDRSEKDGVCYLQKTKTHDAKLRVAIAILINENPELFKNKEFIDKLFNPEELGDYVKSVVIGKPKYAEYRAKVRLGLHGDEVDSSIDRGTLAAKTQELDKLATQIGPLIHQINREHYFENRRKHPKFKEEEPQENDATNVSNMDTQLAAILSISLKHLKQFVSVVKDEAKKQLRKMPGATQEDVDEIVERMADDYGFDKEYIEYLLTANVGVIDNLIQYFEKMEEVGVTMEKVYKLFEQIREQYKNNEQILKTIDLISITLHYSKAIAEAQSNQKTEQSQKYEGFNQKILDKYLDNDDLKRKFDLWYHKIFIPIQLSKTKQELSELKQAIDSSVETDAIGPIGDWRRAFADFEDAKEGRKEAMKADPEKEKQELRAKPWEDWTNADFLRARELGLEELANRYARKHKEAQEFNDEDEENLNSESYVVNYMTKQFKKDKLNRPKGKFIPRFKEKSRFEKILNS